MRLSYGQPFGSLCLQVLGKKAGLAMFSLNMIAQWFVGEGCTVTASRVVFAYSRDGALPGSRWWSKVDKRTKTPVLATWGVLSVSALLGLLMFASPVAIGAVFSIGMDVRIICCVTTADFLARSHCSVHLLHDAYILETVFR